MTAPFKIVMPDPMSSDRRAVERGLAALPHNLVIPGADDWIAEAGDADALIVNLVSVRRPELEALRNCRIISRLGTGVDNVDTEAARARGIAVANVVDYCREEVSDHVLALMLALLRRIVVANADMARGAWRQTAYRPIRRLSTRTIGLVGYGKLARAVGRKAAALGMTVLACDPMVDQDEDGVAELTDFDALLARSDIVSLHVPLLESTRGLMGREALAGMKPDAILINAARGELIDEAAVLAALDADTLGGAALDVFPVEPWVGPSRLRGHPKVVLTPHMAFYSEESVDSLQEQAAAAVREFLQTGNSDRVIN